jgi:hypothetical protein
MVVVERLKGRCENVGCGKLRVDLVMIRQKCSRVGHGWRAVYYGRVVKVNVVALE